MVLQDRLVIIDRLLTLPFPRETKQGNRLCSGPGFHLCVLQASHSFWDDRSQETVETARAEIDAEFQAAATALTIRWGQPETVDLEPYLWRENAVPEPTIRLCQLSNEMLVWRPQNAGRWVALAVGQGDPELPIELLLAVSEAALS